MIAIAGDWDGDGVSTIGLYNQATGQVYLRNENTSGIADITFQYGPAGNNLVPLAGDWNGDGIDSIGLYNPTTATVYLRNENTSGVADITFQYGPAGNNWVPLAGDWDGDGVSTIGLYNQATGHGLFAEREHLGYCRHNIPIWPGRKQLRAICRRLGW